MEEIRKQIEDIICECDLDSDINDELLDKIIKRLTAHFFKTYREKLEKAIKDIEENEDNHFFPITEKLEETNKYLEEIAMCLHEQMHGIGSV